jgi:hypothetical protein
MTEEELNQKAREEELKAGARKLNVDMGNDGNESSKMDDTPENRQKTRAHVIEHLRKLADELEQNDWEMKASVVCVEVHDPKDPPYKSASRVSYMGNPGDVGNALGQLLAQYPESITKRIPGPLKGLMVQKVMADIAIGAMQQMGKTDSDIAEDSGNAIKDLLEGIKNMFRK